MVDLLKTHLFQCAALPRAKPDGALELFEIVKSLGATMLRIDNGPIDKKPQRKIQPTGSIINGVGIKHPALGKGRWHNKIPTAPKHEHGTASFSYIHDNYRFSSTPPLREFTLCQPVEETDPLQCDQAANGQVAFARILYPHLRPFLGWTDESGEIDSENIVVAGQVRFLFWSNIFGSDLAKQIGREFLLNAPGWKKEELDDGGILYVVEEHYSDWHARPSQEALQYFKTKMPRIQHYHAKPFELPGELARIVQIDDETGVETVVYDRAAKKAKRKKD